MISSNDEKLIHQLEQLIDSIINMLNSRGEDTTQGYTHLRKIKNILAHKDLSGMKKINRHLFMDLRMIYDNQLDTGELGEKMNEAYNLSKSHVLFNS